MNRTMLGILFIAFGALALGYHEFTYTTREKVINLGPLQASADKDHTIPLPPIVGGHSFGRPWGVSLLLTRQTAIIFKLEIHVTSSQKTDDHV